MVGFCIGGRLTGRSSAFGVRYDIYFGLPRAHVWKIHHGSVGGKTSQRRSSVRSGLFCTMFEFDTTVRVRYGETDQMGYVYYGDYAQFLEVGRVEALRSLGFPYRRLEEQGVMLPVHDLRITYHRPARYDDLLTIRTRIEALPSVRIGFDYTIMNEAGEVLCEAHTTLVFVDRVTMKPRRAPDALVQALQRIGDH